MPARYFTIDWEFSNLQYGRSNLLSFIMDVTLENDILKIGIRQKGAELATVFNKKTQLEYMWDADPAFWGKSSPVLFPIVGTLRDDVFRFKQKEYSLPRHGFARDLPFETADRQKEGATFLLKSTKESMTKFPFNFELRLMYKSCFYCPAYRRYAL
jgi:galactose mutarotase-like enzyme